MNNVICVNVENTNGKFVGIKYESNSVKIIFPLGYRISSNIDEQKISIRELLDIIKVVKENKIYLKDCQDLSEIETDDLPFDSYKWILNDYLTNGIYIDNEKKYIQDSKGKINWKRTFRTKSYVSNNSLVYLKPIIIKNNNIKNIISEIQTFCIDESLNYLGFLYNISKINQVKNPVFEKYLNIINQELLVSFDDRKKLLLYHMRRIIKNKMGENNKNHIRDYGIERFEYVWEFLIGMVYGTENIKKYEPRVSYFIKGTSEYTPAPLRPDTILKYGNNLYILDAKYYSAGIKNNLIKEIPQYLPGTDSIQKQITYANFVETNWPKDYKNVYNAFLIPFNRENNIFNISDNIINVGYATCSWENDKLKKKISIIFIDTKYLIDLYFKKGNETKLLIKKIIDN